MNNVLWFIGGLAVAGFPLSILWLHAKEARDYFERDRNGIDEQWRKVRAVIAKCSPVTSEVREYPTREGGWVKAWLPTASDVMDAHAMLAGRIDLIDKKPPRPCTCHPDDSPPKPCPKKFALSECRAAATK